MDKQEAIELVKNTSYSVPINDSVKYLKEETVIKIIDGLNEPEKTILPQCIADWLEVCKENLGFGLATAMSHSTSVMKAQSNNVQGWFNLKSNQETFAKAWLYGYEVKKLYTVEIPNPNGSGFSKTYLAKNKDGKVELFTWSDYTSIDFADDWKLEPNAQLTEEEIKKDYAWAWKSNLQNEVL